MFGGEMFGLVQSFARHHGNLHAAAGAGPVEHEVRHRVGGLALECGGDLGATLGGAGAGCIDGGVKHLRRGQDQLGGDPARLKPKRRRAQEGHRPAKVGRVQRDLADDAPPADRPVQKADPLMAEVECETWFHS